MYTHTFISLKKCTKPLSPVEDTKSPRSVCNSAAGLFLWRQAQPSSWVEKKYLALKIAKPLGNRKTTQPLGKKNIFTITQ